jgi:hypothetical protein
VEQGDFGGQYETGMSSSGPAALRDLDRPMSASGQTRKSAGPAEKSAFPSERTIVQPAGQVGNVPILLQKSKVAGLKIFRENTKQRAIADSYDLNRVTDVACEFRVRS